MSAAATPSRIALRLRLDTGVWSVPLQRVHHLAGYATLGGTREDYFLGWLLFHGRQVPVFDLNMVVCEQPTPENFGSRIVLVDAPESAGFPLIGLLAAGATDTVAANDEAAPLLDLDSYLPMLCTLIPAEPVSPAEPAA